MQLNAAQSVQICRASRVDHFLLADLAQTSRISNMTCPAVYLQLEYCCCTICTHNSTELVSFICLSQQHCGPL